LQKPPAGASGEATGEDDFAQARREGRDHGVTATDEAEVATDWGANVRPAWREVRAGRRGWSRQRRGCFRRGCG
jgi:superfamily II DNA helicase RecQ